MNGHAFLIAGVEGDIPAVLKYFGRESGSADVYVCAHRNFGVDDARALCARAALRAVGGEERLFVVAASTLTHEAQNALLKTLEEPPAGAQFCIITPAPETLLATVRSRTTTLVLPERRAETEETLVSARDFLRAPVKSRLEMLAPLLEKDDNDERNMEAVFAFLSEVERALSPHARARADVREGIAAIYRARSYLSDKGAMLKVLLEQVALLVPMV